MAEDEDQKEPRDVLAAEEFGVPAPDPMLRRDPLKVPQDPEDPEGQEPPHDVLAGEEFPIPAGPGRSGGGEVPESPSADGPGRRSKKAAGAIGVLVAGIAAVLRRRRGGKTT